MIEAVIFDLDGVLVSTDELHFEAWKALADRLNIVNFTKADNVRQRGVSRMASLEVVLEKDNKIYSEKEKTSLANFKNDLYVKSLDSLDDEALLSGALETLKLLKERSVGIALGSASKNAPLIIEKTGISSYFDAIACGADVTKSKPDPEVFQVAAMRLGVAPVNCLVVEDSDAGIRAAKTAGMTALAVGAAKDNEEADYSCQDLSDVSINWDEILG